MTDVFQLDLDDDVISHLADDRSVNVFIGEQVTGDIILDDFVRSVFEWQLAHVKQHGRAATASVLAEEFQLEIQEPLTAVGDLIERLRERWVRNNAREAMERIARGYEADPLAVGKLMIEQGRRFADHSDARGEQYGTGDFDRAIRRYNELVLRGRGPSFGFEKLDAHFHGQRGLTYLMAAPGTYKSWLSTNAALENIQQGNSVWFFSLELPAEESDMRLRCMAANVPFWRYLNHALSSDDTKALAEASELIDSMGHYRVVKPEPGKRSIDAMVGMARDHGADSIYIDQLQYVETNEGKPLGGCDPREYWRPLDTARNLSDDGPIWIVHQFNRSVMNADSMPEMQQAKGAAAVEETATLALGLWANKDMRKSHIVELGTLKSRHYQYGAWEIGIQLSRGCNFKLLGEADKE